MTDIGATLERDYGVQISCSRGTLDENMERAISIPRFLVVYLHNPNHGSTDDFIDNVLSSARMSALVNDRVMLYGADVTTSEGAQLASRLECTTYPFLAVFFKKQIICRLQGADAVKPDRTFAELEKGLDVWDHELSKEIAIRMERERSQVQRVVEETAESERMQRDRALLEAFDQKEAQRKRDVEAAAVAERNLKRQREEEALALAKQKEEAEAEARRVEEALQLAKSLALSRVTAPPSADTDPSLVLCVNIRFPKRAIERRFLLSEPVESLYSFVETTEEFSGAPFKMMLSGMPPKPIVRSDHQTLGDAVGGQLRVAIMFREG